MRRPDHLTIKNFTNPGVGSAMNMNAIMKDYSERYHMYISKTIKMKTYIDGKSYVFLLEIPSEKNHKYKTNIFYDVIVEFYPIKDGGNEESKKVNEYGMRVFSNCPTFTFTFTNIYHKMDALYKKVHNDVYSVKAIEDSANVKNARNLTGIEKSVWYALRKISDETGYYKDRIDGRAENLPEGTKFPGTIFDKVMSQEGKLEEVQNVDKIRLKRKTKQKASTHTRSFSIGGKTVATEEKNKKSVLERTFANSLHNSKVISDNIKSKFEQAKTATTKMASDKFTPIANKFASSKLLTDKFKKK